MFARRVRTRLIPHPIPPGKAQTKVWKQPHPLICEHRPQIPPAPPAVENVFAGQQPPPRDEVDGLYIAQLIPLVKEKSQEKLRGGKPLETESHF
jgi:hypothetical protein